MKKSQGHLGSLTSWAAISCLGVSLLTVACGDSGNGSTVVAPLTPVINTGRVTFNYQLATTRTALDKEVAFVKYTFQNSSGLLVNTTDFYGLEYSQNLCDITVSNVSAEAATGAVAYYFDKDKNVLGFGYDKLYWQGTSSPEANVSNPDYCADFSTLSDLRALAAPQVVAIQGWTRLSAVASYVKDAGVTAQVININKMGCTFTAPQGYLKTANIDESVFVGAKYGTETVAVKPTSAKLSNLQTAQLPVYVTDAVLSELIIPFPNLYNSQGQTFLIPDYSFNLGGIAENTGGQGQPVLVDTSWTFQAYAHYTTETAGAPSPAILIDGSKNLQWKYSDNNDQAKCFAMTTEDGAATLTAQASTTKSDTLSVTYSQATDDGEDLSASINLEAVTAKAQLLEVPVNVDANSDKAADASKNLYPLQEDSLNKVPLGVKIPVLLEGYYTFGNGRKTASLDITDKAFGDEKHFTVTATSSVAGGSDGTVTRDQYYSESSAIKAPAFLVSSVEESAIGDKVQVVAKWLDDSGRALVTSPAYEIAFIKAVGVGK